MGRFTKPAAEMSADELAELENALTFAVAQGLIKEDRDLVRVPGLLRAIRSLRTGELQPDGGN